MALNHRHDSVCRRFQRGIHHLTYEVQKISMKHTVGYADPEIKQIHQLANRDQLFIFFSILPQRDGANSERSL